MIWPDYKGHLLYSNTFVINPWAIKLSLDLVFLKESVWCRRAEWLVSVMGMILAKTCAQCSFWGLGDGSVVKVLTA